MLPVMMSLPRATTAPAIAARLPSSDARTFELPGAADAEAEAEAEPEAEPETEDEPEAEPEAESLADAEAGAEEEEEAAAVVDDGEACTWTCTTAVVVGEGEAVVGGGV